MKLLTASIFLSGLLLVGCSDQTRDQYSQAGQEAGHAMKQDLKHGEKAADAAGNAAKKSLKEDDAKAKADIHNATKP